MVVAPLTDIEEGERIETHDQQPCHGDRCEHRIHRGAAVLLPIDVLQVQDQRELIENQRRTDTEKY